MKSVVSIYPRPIDESKPGLIPGVFQMPAGSFENPQVLHVQHSTCPVYAFDGKSIPTTIVSDEIANSIVNDFIAASVAVTEDAQPGLFTIDGHLTIEEIKKKYADKLKEINERQNRWFASLVALADDDWSKTRQHRQISDLQRDAARALNLEREWLRIQAKIITTCPACAAKVEGTPVVCKACNYILDEARYKTMKFATR